MEFRRSWINGVCVAIVLPAVLVAAFLLLGRSQEHVLRDIEGVIHGSLEDAPQGKLTLLFFLMSDCPVANQYAPEIQRICTTYGPEGTRCFLVYVDPSMTADAVRKHVKDYGYSFPAILDTDHRLVEKAGASVSSEVAVFSTGAELKYRGRIDNLYADLGIARQHVTHHDLRDALDTLLAGRGVQNAITEAIGCFIPQATEEN